MIKRIKGTSWGQPRVLAPGAIPLHSHLSKRFSERERRPQAAAGGLRELRGKGFPSVVQERQSEVAFRLLGDFHVLLAVMTSCV